MTWDKDKPAGTEQVRTGDEYIREFKRDVQDAAQVEHVFPVNTGDPKALHSFGYGPTENLPVAGHAGRLFFDNDFGILQYDDGANWQDLTNARDIIPSGTVMAFIETSAPTGWTKLTVQNDKILRVVSGTGGGSGGNWTIPVDSGGSHSHTFTTSFSTGHGYSQLMSTGDYQLPEDHWYFSTLFPHTVSHTHTSQVAGAHVHSSDAAWRPAYLNVILCSKD